MTKDKTPMITRVPEALRESLRLLSINPEYGSLHAMHEHLVGKFLDEKPYRLKGFAWSQPAKRGTTGWSDNYNVVVSDELQKRVKKESVKIEVSLTTLLYSALAWWSDLHRQPQ